MLESLLYLSFMLLFAHCISDTTFQTSFMAQGKVRNRPIDMSRVPAGQKPMNLWYMWLTHHAVIHGGMVALVTGRYEFGIIETISHWIIDFFKCEGKYNPVVDQLLHLGCKVVYIVLIGYGF